MTKTYSSEPYRVPDGFVDVPFCYVYDASGLTPGPVYNNIPVILQGDAPFILRHVAGVNSFVNPASDPSPGRFNYQNSRGQYAAGNSSVGFIPPNNWPVIPEKIYPIGSSILQDFYNVSSASTPFAAYFGAKRFPIGQFPLYITPYDYDERYHVYNYPLTITQAKGTPPFTLYQVIDSYDFELMRVLITGGSGGVSQGTLLNEFFITLYHANGRAMSSGAIPQAYLNSAVSISGNDSVPDVPYQGCFPVPTVVYPRGASLQFDIVSRLSGGQPPPQSYTISFEGVWRVPR